MRILDPVSPSGRRLCEEALRLRAQGHSPGVRYLTRDGREVQFLIKCGKCIKCREEQAHRLAAAYWHDAKERNQTAYLLTLTVKARRKVNYNTMTAEQMLKDEGEEPDGTEMVEDCEECSLLEHNGSRKENCFYDRVMERRWTDNQFFYATTKWGMEEWTTWFAHFMQQARNRVRPKQINSIRTVEGTKQGTPHWHIYLENDLDTVKKIRALWMEHTPATRISAQDIRKVTDHGKALYYVLKYVTKGCDRLGWERGKYRAVSASGNCTGRAVVTDGFTRTRGETLLWGAHERRRAYGRLYRLKCKAGLVKEYDEGDSYKSALRRMHYRENATQEDETRYMDALRVWKTVYRKERAYSILEYFNDHEAVRGFVEPPNQLVLLERGNGQTRVMLSPKTTWIPKWVSSGKGIEPSLTTADGLRPRGLNLTKDSAS